MQENEFDCRYRLHQDGLPLMLPYITRQLLRLTADEFLQLVTERSLVIPWDARDTPAHTSVGVRGCAAPVMCEQMSTRSAYCQRSPVSGSG